MNDLVAKCIIEAREAKNAHFLQEKVEQLKSEMGKMLKCHFEEKPGDAFERFFTFQVYVNDPQKYRIEFVSDGFSCTSEQYKEPVGNTFFAGTTRKEVHQIKELEPLLTRLNKEEIVVMRGRVEESKLYLQYMYEAKAEKTSGCKFLNDIIIQARNRAVEIATKNFQSNIVDALKSFFEINPDEAFSQSFTFYISEVDAAKVEIKISHISTKACKLVWTETYNRSGSVLFLNEVFKELGQQFEFAETKDGMVVSYNMQ